MNRCLVLCVFSVFFMVTNVLATERIKLLASLTGNSLPKAFNQPSGLFFDEIKKRLYVADTANNRFVSYDSKFNYLAEFDPGGEFRFPVSIVRNNAGHIYFINGKNKALYLVDIANKILNEVKIVDAPKRQNPILLSKIAFNHDDKLYVIDSANGRILVLDFNGRCLQEIMFDGKPVDFADLTVDSQGSIYTVSTLSGRVTIFGKDGEIISNFGKRGRGAGEFDFPVSIATSEKGLVYVLDKHKGSVLIFDKKGDFLFRFSSKGSLPGKLLWPSHIFLDKEGKIYIMDSGNNRVQVFSYED